MDPFFFLGTAARLARSWSEDRPVRVALLRRMGAASPSFIALVMMLVPVSATAAPSASIAANRTSGVAPLAVRFDATGSDCDGDGTGQEWNHDLEQCLYSWDFGDPTAPPYEHGARAHAGMVASANEGKGFIAGHVFENPGSYTVTLTITDPSGQKATRTQTINVNAFSGATYCFRSNSTGTFSGCPSGATQVTQSDFDTALSNCGIGSGAKRCLFRRGDTFTTSSETNASGAGTIIGAFGSGSRPIVNGNDYQGVGSGANVTIMDLEFVNVTLGGMGDHRLLYRNVIRDVPSRPGVFYYGPGHNGLYLVRNEVARVSTSAALWGLYLHAENMVALGNWIHDSGSETGSQGHQLRLGDHSRSVWASNTIGPQNGGHGFKVTGENSGSGGVQYWVFRDNLVLDGGRGFNRIVSMIPQQDDSPGPVKRGLVESNFCRGSSLSDSHDDRTCFFIAQMQDMTFRNNIVDMTRRFASLVQIRNKNLAGRSSDPWPEASNITVANNTGVYSTGNSGDKGAVVDVSSGVSNIRVVNNLFYHGTSYSPGIVSCGSACALNSNNLKVSSNPFEGTTFQSVTSFKLKNGAAPINAGVSRPESFFDLGASLRTGLVDVGAWEFGAGGSPPPPPVLLP